MAQYFSQPFPEPDRNVSLCLPAGLVKLVHDSLSAVPAAAPAAVPLGKVIHAAVFALVQHHSPKVPKGFRNI